MNKAPSSQRSHPPQVADAKSAFVCIYTGSATRNPLKDSRSARRIVASNLASFQ